MAKYLVAHKCGHESRIDLTGPHRQREWRLEQEEERDCCDCQQTRRDRENAESAAAAQAAGWPALSGSERQIAWAQTLRANAVASVRELAGRWRAEYPDAGADLAGLVESALLGVTDTRWWIDSRDNLPSNAVALSGLEVVRAIGQLDLLSDPRLGPHTVGRFTVRLPWPHIVDSHMATALVPVCSCGWRPTNTDRRSVDEAHRHIFEDLSEEERAAVLEAHPQDRPHVCTEELGMRRCPMKAVLR